MRQALNFAIDRPGLCNMINGTATPAQGLYPPNHPLFGNPKMRYTFDPAKAKELLAAACYGDARKLKAKIMISTSGSGQMLPIPMNELLQQNFAAVGIDIDFDVVEWGTMLVAMRSSPSQATSHGSDAINISLGYSDPGQIFRMFGTQNFPPVSTNWGHYSNKQVDDYLTQAQSSFDPAEQSRLTMKAHEILVDEAAWLFICHDLNPRAMSKHVKDFRPAQSWSQDFTQITMS